MPITNIHEEVALNITKKYKELDKTDFYIGNYAPDSVNLNGLAPKHLRWIAHQRKDNLDDWRNSLKEFYKEEQNNYPKEFLLGYITHILTDIVYDDFFYNDVAQLIKKDYPKTNDVHFIMGDDMSKYAYHSNYKDKIFEILRQSNKYYYILNITEDMMLKFKNELLNSKYNEGNSVYINKELVSKLSDQVLKELKEYIEE